jgi:hypothetical protein
MVRATCVRSKAKVDSHAHSITFSKDYKVTNAEGFGKDRLFEILDTLEQGTRSILEQARKDLLEKYGPDAAEPWNMSYKMAGSVVAKMDPYFPFAASVERYVKSYAALGISYKGATIN